MEGFSLTMALVDAIPVLMFGASMILIAVRFGSPLFIVGAACSTLAGCCKVIWKMIIGLTQKKIKWLNQCFAPLMASGFLLMVVSLILNWGKINLPTLICAVTAFPSVLFFVLWIVVMSLMAWFRKRKFDNSAKANWIAQYMNIVGQAALLFGILLA